MATWSFCMSKLCDASANSIAAEVLTTSHDTLQAMMSIHPQPSMCDGHSGLTRVTMFWQPWTVKRKGETLAVTMVQCTTDWDDSPQVARTLVMHSKSPVFEFMFDKQGNLLLANENAKTYYAGILTGGRVHNMCTGPSASLYALLHIARLHLQNNSIAFLSINGMLDRLSTSKRPDA